MLENIFYNLLFYFKMNIKQKYIIGIIIALIIIFVTEIFYRRPLYDFSVEYISKIRQSGFFHNFYIFWAKYFNQIINYTGIFCTILFCPLNTFFSHLSSQYILDFVNGIFKSLYSNERPFWDIYIDVDNTKFNKYTNQTLTKLTECNTSFGNPSGHAMRATYTLILWNLLINSKYFNKLPAKKKIIIKYYTLVLSMLGIFFVLYSRINRQAHSFNQIIFGTLIGIAIFFILCYIVEINKLEPDGFCLILDKYKFYVIPSFLVLYVISIVLGLARHNPKEEYYKNLLVKICKSNAEKLFGRQKVDSASIIFIFLGAYIGLLYLNYNIKKKYNNNLERFYNWNKNGILQITIVLAFNFGFSFSHLWIVKMFYDFNIAAKLIFSIIINSIIGFLAFGFYFYHLFDIFLLSKEDVEIDSLTKSLEDEIEKGYEQTIN